MFRRKPRTPVLTPHGLGAGSTSFRSGPGAPEAALHVRAFRADRPDDLPGVTLYASGKAPLSTVAVSLTVADALRLAGALLNAADNLKGTTPPAPLAVAP